MSLSTGFQRVAFALLCILPALLAATRAGADGALSLIAILFLLYSIAEKNWAWIKRPEVKLLFLLWFYLVSNSWLLSTHADALRTLVWVRFIIFYCALTHWLLPDARAIKTASYWGIGLITLIMVDTYWQYIFGVSLSGKADPATHRLGGPMATANVGNLMLKLSLPFIGAAWYCLRQEKNTRALFALAAYAVILFILIPLTGERSTNMLLLLALGTLAAIFIHHMPKFRRYVWLCTVLFIFLIAVLFYTQPVVQLRGTALAEQLMDFWGTPYGQLFKGGWSLFTLHPIMGIGPGKYLTECTAIMASHNLTYCDVHPHNIYLQWLAETGFIGFALFVVSMAAIIRSIGSIFFSDWRIIPSAFMLTTLAVLLFPIMVTQSVFSNWPAILFWYSLSLAVCIPRVAKS